MASFVQRMATKLYRQTTSGANSKEGQRHTNRTSSDFKPVLIATESGVREKKEREDPVERL